MEVSGQLLAPAAFLSGERATGTHWIGGWVGPRVGLDAVEKRKIVHYRESNPGSSSLSLYRLSYTINLKRIIYHMLTYSDLGRRSEYALL
jgi:hypothetical protein